MNVGVYHGPILSSFLWLWLMLSKKWLSRIVLSEMLFADDLVLISKRM